MSAITSTPGVTDMVFGLDMPSVETSVFFVCALICLAGAFGVIWSRNPVHAALSLVATLFGVAVLFLNQNAQLLAAVQVIVYTGAIVVLILFVMMLLGVDREEDIYTEPLVGQRGFAFVVGAGLFLILFGVFMIGGTGIVTGAPNCQDGKIVTSGSAYEQACPTVDPTLAANGGANNVQQIGKVLFFDFAFAFEITAALLTIAIVGAVLLARRPKDVQEIPPPETLDYVPLQIEEGH
jgi:NADH-quinone oxidoreductase subunit J